MDDKERLISILSYFSHSIIHCNYAIGNFVFTIEIKRDLLGFYDFEKKKIQYH